MTDMDESSVDGDEEKNRDTSMDVLAPGIREMRCASHPPFIREYEDWRRTQQDYDEYMRGWTGL